MRELDPKAEERNYAKTPLGKAEVERVVKAAGSVAAAINTRHATAKKNGWKEHPPTVRTFAAAAAKENNLLRRPIVVKGNRAVVGNDPEGIRWLLSGTQFGNSGT